MSTQYKVKLAINNDIRGNFIRLPTDIVDELYSRDVDLQDYYFQIDSKLQFLSWDGLESTHADCMEVNAAVATQMGVLSQVGQYFGIEVLVFGEDAKVRDVYVVPVTSADWEIMENNVLLLQSEFIQYTKLVYLEGIITCYIGNNLTCQVKVQKIEPKGLAIGQLVEGSLVIVEPKVHEKKRNVSKKIEMPSKIMRSLIWTVENEENVVIISKDQFVSDYGYITMLDRSLADRLNLTKRIAVKFIKDTTSDIPTNHICMSKSLRSSFFPRFENNGIRFKLDFITNNDLPWTFQQLMLHLKIKIYHSKPITEKSKENINRILFERNTITHNTVIRNMHSNNDIDYFLLEIFDHNDTVIPYFNMSSISLDKIQYINVNLRDEIMTQIQKHENEKSVLQTNERTFLTLNDQISNIVEYLLSPLVSSAGLLMHGKLGIGKSSNLLRLQELLLFEHTCHVQFIDCDTLLEGFNYEKMEKFIDNVLNESYLYQPTVLLLDNADSVFHQIQNEEVGTTANEISDKLSLYFIDEFQKVFNKNNSSVRIVFTARSQSYLNKLFFDSHFINEIYSLKYPNKLERAKFIDALIIDPDSPIVLNFDNTLSSSDIAVETDGYSLNDLENLLFKIYYDCQLNDTTTMTYEKFTKMIETFTPTALQNVPQQKQELKVKWDQIGALKDVKKILLETLEWPTKYAPIFQNSTLRLRSGILLYGYPGCGKTLLATAVASQCGLNFISVKGPEILNKYIGASEQNVRELFERAESIKPCILFFDEFDSIAPKRGHDSTGVTDRVVNQLLTQMDGAEGLDGVYVLAATSRPDLIDPALLRPGRLDKSVLCNLPNEIDRFDILKTLISSEKFSIACDDETKIEYLKRLATETKGYSGADLQALCYNAYLKGIHRKLKPNTEAGDHSDLDLNNHDPLIENIDYLVKQKIESDLNSFGKGFKHTKEDISLILQNILREYDDIGFGEKDPSISKGVNTSPAKTELTLDDLLEAVRETKPSISHKEYRHLSEIYNRFQNNRDGSLPQGNSSHETGSRVSLM